MKNIYIFDESQSSKRNGVGTYINELVYCLRKHYKKICMISFNTEQEEFTIAQTEGMKWMKFPYFQHGFYRENYATISFFLQLHIEDSSDNIFFVNHSPCSVLLKELKDSHPLSKIIFVAHDQGWTSILKGNHHKLEQIISKKHEQEINKKYTSLIDLFTEEQKIYQVADKVICFNDDFYEVINNLYQSPHNIHKIEHGHRDNYNIKENGKHMTRGKLNIKKDEIIILFTGRLTEVKGIDILINSFCQVINRFPKTRLIVAGSSASLDFQNRLLKLSQKAISNISFCGLVSHNEIKDLYTIADIGVVSSYIEPFGYTGMEMLMHGLPIIASDGFGVRNMFINKVNAIIANIGVTSEEYQSNMSNAIIELLNSKELCKELSINARKTYLNRYTIDQMSENYKTLINNL